MRTGFQCDAHGSQTSKPGFQCFSCKLDATFMFDLTVVVQSAELNPVIPSPTDRDLGFLACLVSARPYLPLENSWRNGLYRTEQGEALPSRLPLRPLPASKVQSGPLEFAGIDTHNRPVRAAGVATTGQPRAQASRLLMRTPEAMRSGTARINPGASHK